MDIIRETASWIAVRKPAGMAVQTRRVGEKDLESELLNLLQSRQQEPGQGRKQSAGTKPPYLAVIHRLDQPVEGIVLFAKTAAAAADLSAQMQKQEMEKEYLACAALLPNTGISCSGTAEDGEGRWHTLTDYLVRDGRTNSSRVTSAGTPGAKKAELDYRVISASGSSAILSVRLRTGRHHQIRVQLAHAGMPIIGDRKYGNCREGQTDADWHSSCRFPALCACRLAFRDPDSHEPVELKTDARHERLHGKV